jgi:hypothetical protein
MDEMMAENERLHELFKMQASALSRSRKENRKLQALIDEQDSEEEEEKSDEEIIEFEEIPGPDEEEEEEPIKTTSPTGKKEVDFFAALNFNVQAPEKVKVIKMST